MTCNETLEQRYPDYEEYDESMISDNLPQEIVQLESQKKPNLEDTEVVNLGNKEDVKETRINIHLEVESKEELVELLRQYINLFAWSYDDMPRLTTDIVSHRFPTDPTRPPVKQKPRKFKPDLNLRKFKLILLEANVVTVTFYSTWLVNVVPIPKKDGKIRICVDYRDLNKASPKDDFLLPNVNILINYYAKYELQSFMDCFAEYHQILMQKNDAKKSVYPMPWGVYC
ncbi:uncharacterized protein [Nicotiana tomentosiformis]|uniref:uncharacterized protein n=1 Tax=Nicotiana tomentosiformis TaxID=4098 RepID=UPI00051BDD35|nr:uncharacterized protein LOC117279366 [Nicotiana tomentosiformis]